MRIYFKDKTIQTKDNRWIITGYFDVEDKRIKITRFEGSVVGIASTAFQVATMGMIRALPSFPAEAL